MRIALKEIIWEITGRCQNGCAYCGSAEVWDDKIDNDTIINIAKKIFEFPPKELDISGGDPLLVPFDTHKEVVSILKGRTICKILFNPKSLRTHKEDKLQKLSLYSYMGISVNTEEEIETFLKYKSDILNLQIPYTIITNFNLTNYHLVDFLVSDVVQDQTWQIQFSITPNSLYKYPLAVKRLNEDLGKYPDLKLVIADNGNSGECGAGLVSLGILSDGRVVPCLAMRSWLDATEIEKHVQGRLVHSDLKDIWVNEFKEQRFGSFTCCKDICDRQLICPVKLAGAKRLDWPLPQYQTVPVPVPTTQPTVTLYAVHTDREFWTCPTIERTVLPNVQAYAVQAWPISFTQTVSSNVLDEVKKYGGNIDVTIA